MVKSQKRDKSTSVKTGQFIKTANGYTPLAKVHTDSVGAIPVIVSGNVSTKRNAQINNRNTSCWVNGGIGVTKQKKKKIIVIGDSHARGCAREISNCLGKEFEVSGTVMPGAGLAHIQPWHKKKYPT